MSKRHEINTECLERLVDAGVSTVVEAMLLAELVLLGKPVSLKELTQVADIPYTSASRIAWTLVEKGFIAHQADPEDRRVRLLEATPKGIELF